MLMDSVRRSGLLPPECSSRLAGQEMPRDIATHCLRDEGGLLEASYKRVVSPRLWVQRLRYLPGHQHDGSMCGHGAD